ncbi:MAG: pseudouridine synthase [Planctomycetes bacterium HGW-Planctomycetes-1]|nr:MAG: pseudouridine synthase [Planctomycetes bacterium HGW-Planctomycetes-1]
MQKILAAAGIDSRRNCEQLILDGLVKVNGRVVDSLPAFADADKDIITVDGRKIRPAGKVYYLLNKPKGVICTNDDPQAAGLSAFEPQAEGRGPRGRKKAVDLIDSNQRIFCAGRLDVDTTGAIILTNDSVLANLLTHPRYCLEKTYLVTINSRITPDAAEKLKKGVWLAEGKTMPAKLKVLKASDKQSLLEIKIRQGLNRQIRRIMARLGYKVTSLKRTQIGRISLQRLGIGHYRTLTNAEVSYLKKGSEPKTRNSGRNRRAGTY